MRVWQGQVGSYLMLSPAACAISRNFLKIFSMPVCPEVRCFSLRLRIASGSSMALYACEMKHIGRDQVSGVEEYIERVAGGNDGTG